ncbi:helix-turn-helix domain-containing protein [Arthrobacter sp. BPSS-3]|uniref:helix-turn-helix domain-containing protein n=1 Tax=Arthrobacter sp. BPSS-3 TaxID=3366580 RepID=UPI0037DC1D5E
MPESTHRYASPATAAKYADVTPRTIHNWIARGILTAYRVNAKVIRVDLNEIDGVLAPAGGAR